MAENDAIEIYEGDPTGIADFILGSMREKNAKAHTPILERAGKPYIPGSGTEGMEFEDSWCGRCDRYRAMHGDADTMDCQKGHLTAAWASDGIEDPNFPKAWVYDAKGKPSCSDWTQRTIAADGVPPTLCAGAKTPDQERAAYERALRGEA